MLLTLTTTHTPATDLGFLLHKHPDRLQSFDLSVGKAHVFYPRSSAEETTVALLLDLDSIAMVRKGRQSDGGFALAQYVNDRPYVASSFLSVALARAFSTALNGTCHKRPELVDTPMPLVARLSVVSAPDGGEPLIRKFFEPLGYTVGVIRHNLDSHFPAWGDSRYYTLTLTQTTTVQRLLAHLYVLLPALDQDKHYYVSDHEIQKLLDKGEGWLAAHPAAEQITRRYMNNLSGLAREALDQLHGENTGGADAGATEFPKKATLHQQRLGVVLDHLKACGAESVLDLGCGEGKLLRLLLQERQFRRIVGMDVSYAELSKAMRRLHYEEMAPKQRERLELIQGSLLYRDARLAGFDAAAVVEVIEHLDEDRLQAFEQVVFGAARPATVLVTTPNAEYNTVFETLTAGALRHADHRFEWTRAEFADWAERVGQEFRYRVTYAPIGPEHADVGAPSQLAIFTHAH